MRTQLVRVVGMMAAMLVLSALPAPNFDASMPLLGELMSQEAHAQVTCEQCSYWYEYVPGQTQSESGYYHEFTGECEGGGANGGGGGEPDAGEYCARCGGSSSCHPSPQMGLCHIECGPGGGELAQAVITELESAIGHGDLNAVLRLTESFTWVALADDGGSITVTSPCHTVDADQYYAIPASFGLAVQALAEQD